MLKKLKKLFSGELLTAELIFKFSLLLFFILIIQTILFLWLEDITFSKEINHEKFGTFGDFFGGVVGSIWAFCGIILFYLALKEQRKDIQLNKEALDKQKESLDKQIKALELQGNEFVLQRKEMMETRKVFISQNKTFQSQKFDATFFSLIDLLTKTRDSLNKLEKEYFTVFKNEIKDKLNKNFFQKDKKQFDNILDSHNLCVKVYKALFMKKREHITSYFKVLYRILNIIENATHLNDLERNQYVKILRTQLNENELLILYYHSQTKYGNSYYKYILKYNLLKHIPLLSKFEFIFFIKNNKLSKINDIDNFNDILYSNLFDFLKNFSFEIYDYSRSIKIKNFYFRFEMENPNEMLISFVKENEKEITNILNTDISIFIKYFSNFLYDIFYYSRYNTKVTISVKSDKNKLSFFIQTYYKLDINYDLEKRKNG